MNEARQKPRLALNAVTGDNRAMPGVSKPKDELVF
jgi:hypothetical protein